jgi:LuxR family maltose regulon positive regulatory protein
VHTTPGQRLTTGLVDRQRRAERVLSALQDRRLVLLCAPAGFGKTCLLAQAMAALPPEVARVWVHADPGDDLHALLHAIAQALDPLDPPWTMAPDALPRFALEPGGLRRVAEELAHALRHCEVQRGVLVIDDLQNLLGAQPVQWLELLVPLLPDGWALALTTRERPAMHLARWRVGGLMAEFEQADLLFDREEVQALLALRGEASLDAQALLRNTGGWAAGLAMRLMVEASGGATQRRLGQRRLFEYLASEVLEGLPSPLREFLLRCSVLDRLSAERCVVVGGDQRAAHWLDEIDRRGLFSSVLESDESTLVLHDLFREFLQHRLAQEQPQALSAAWLRAADTEPDFARRIDLLQKAQALERAEDVLYEASSSLNLSEAARLIERFPPAWRETSPTAAYVRGLSQWWTDLSICADAEQSFDRAAMGFEALGRPERAYRARACRAKCLLTLARFEDVAALRQQLRASQIADREADLYLAHLDLMTCLLDGPADAPLRTLNRLVDLLDGQPVEMWNRVSRVLGNLIFFGPGFDAAVQRFLAGARVRVADAHPSLSVTLTYYDAVDAFNRADLMGALSMLQRMKEDASWHGGKGRLEALPLIVLALRGPWDAARQQSLHNLVGSGFLEQAANGRAVCILLLIALAQGDPAPARQAIERKLPWAGSPLLQEVFPDIVAGRLALDSADPEQARERLLPLAARLRASGMYPHAEIFLAVSLATAQWRCGGASAAWQALCPVFTLMRESAALGPVVVLGQSLLDELAHAEWHGVAQPEELAELTRWAEHRRRLRQGAGPAPSGVETAAPARIEGSAAAGLSRREIEVLERLAVGESNKVIARALELSPHTVKRHVARIFSRLGVESRGAAAAWYRGAA